MPGFFVFEETDTGLGSNQHSTRHRPRADREPGSKQNWMRFWTDNDRTIVMEGRGPRFDSAQTQLSEAVAEATARSVANGRWLTMQLRPVLVRLGCPADAIDRLTALLSRWTWSEAPDGSAVWTFATGD